jgi:ectoine hydroxylase-related dioxygenase (phytanoyl-CoA dioxygenase family)
MDLELHPWNRDFSWCDHREPFGFVTVEQAQQFDEVGYFVVADAFDATTLRQLDDALASGDAQVKRFLEQAPDGRFSVAGLDTQTVAPHAVTRSDFARRFCANEILTGLARDLVGPEVRLYWDQSVYKQPNSAEPVLWHQDNGYTYVDPQAYLTCWIAITDATPENGCIAVMPGEHKRGTLAHLSTAIGEECWGDWSTAVSVPVAAGSIVVFSSLTPHATKANVTDDVRKAYIVQYTPDGAVALHGDPNTGPPSSREPLGDDDRRYWVVRGGKRVDPVSS